MINLIELIKNNDLVGVIKAIENGADVNLKDEWGRTALHWAVEKENLEMVKYLVENGADANLLDIKGRTAFTFAVEKGNLEMVKLFIEKGLRKVRM